MTNRVLSLLEQAGERYISGEQLSKQLGISRTAIWKHIHKLKLQGYELEASRNRGYRLLSKPDKINISDLVQRLHGTKLVTGIKYFDTVESTQNIAHQLAQDDAPSGTLVIADQQTSGRGRMGRNWVSPAGKGVYMSMVLRPELPLQFAPQLTLLVAVALCIALREVTKLPIGIKWPNDLLIHGKKISGILLESAADDEKIRHVIMGIGISVNMTVDDYPVELQTVASSLRIEAAQPFERTAVIVAFLSHFEQFYRMYQQEGFAPIRMLWESLSVTLHKPRQFHTSNGIVSGEPISLLDSGALLFQLENGEQVPIFSASAVIDG